ncbi:MAG: hypothetical protein HYZ81_04650 [Nitrospinae bacterium]|nr:hypothetical protein [Nitrospinota bacterium]
MLRQKVEPRGIIGSGWATTPAYQHRHWEDERRRRGELANFVGLRFDRLLDAEQAKVAHVA